MALTNLRKVYTATRGTRRGHSASRIKTSTANQHTISSPAPSVIVADFLDLFHPKLEMMRRAKIRVAPSISGGMRQYSFTAMGSERFRFGLFEFNAATRELRREGV